MQVDGPTHFASNTLRPLGPTLLKRQLLAARGWEVVSVPYFHWSELHTDYERQLYIYLALQVSERSSASQVPFPIRPFEVDCSVAEAICTRPIMLAGTMLIGHVPFASVSL